MISVIRSDVYNASPLDRDFLVTIRPAWTIFVLATCIPAWFTQPICSSSPIIVMYNIIKERKRHLNFRKKLLEQIKMFTAHKEFEGELFNPVLARPIWVGLLIIIRELFCERVWISRNIYSNWLDVAKSIIQLVRIEDSGSVRHFHPVDYYTIALYPFPFNYISSFTLLFTYIFPLHYPYTWIDLRCMPFFILYFAKSKWTV